MTEHEARRRVQEWIRECSPFAAAVVAAKARPDGSWQITVECSDFVWIQTVSAEGDISEPVWIE
ncbi:MAG: hypothetical protein NZ578_12685 [Candidatus Binatia bacterium]|nr:hypothetical protein [Candidatus Binatia bacterium]